jgi:hypothetical protein
MAVVERGPSHFVAYDAAFRRRLEAGLKDAQGDRERASAPAISPRWSAKSRCATLRRCERSSDHAPAEHIRS